jgi:ASC-1-like (ASCH) protein
MPLLFTKREMFEWLKIGKKTIDIRKGKPRTGEIAVFQSGRNILRLKIIKKETGKLTEVLRSDNYRFALPSIMTLDDAFAYLHRLYEGYDDGVFTAYYCAPEEQSTESYPNQVH